jgi:hypothetical protein
MVLEPTVVLWLWNASFCLRASSEPWRSEFNSLGTLGSTERTAEIASERRAVDRVGTDRLKSFGSKLVILVLGQVCYYCRVLMAVL